MAKVAVPIIKITYPAEHAYSSELYELFEQEGVWNPNEDFTFTGRVTVPRDAESAPALRRRLSEKIRELLGEDAGGRLMRLLEECDWDVSFFVDCW